MFRSTFLGMSALVCVFAITGATPVLAHATTEWADTLAGVADSTVEASPRAFVRDLSADRPDITESPQTVERGRFQVEMDIMNVGFARDGDLRERSIGLAAVNVRYGVHDRVDLQIITEWWTRESEWDVVSDARSNRVGFGDVMVRAKINLWGNDGGRTAFGIMPFVTFPTATAEMGSGAFEGGLILPFGADLGGGWEGGVMSEFGIARREDDTGHTMHILQSAAVGRELFGPVGAYVEVVAMTAPWEREVAPRATANTGFTWGVTPDFQLDAGANFGLTSAAERVVMFFGVSFRR